MSLDLALSPALRAARAVLAALAVVSALGATAVAEPLFPTITTKDLNGRELTFPAGLPGERSLILIAFFREQQRNLDTWIDALDLRAPDAPAWIEMPVVPDYGAIWRNFVDSGMRSGIVTPEARAKVFTVFGSRRDFRESAGLGPDDRVYILVVDRDGRILAKTEGDHTPSKAAPLLEALGGG